MTTKNAPRTRNYSTIVYPESAPKNWLTLLEEELVPCFISPLHDSDLEATGEVKKAHYHVVIMFSGVKTVAQAQEVFTKINGVGCVAMNGADYFSVISSSADKYQSIKQMIQFCDENNIIMYADLLEYSMIHQSDWFRVLCDNGTVVIKEYLRSREYRSNKKYMK